MAVMPGIKSISLLCKREVEAWDRNAEDPCASAVRVLQVGKQQAIVVFVPFKLLKAYHKIQQRLVRELEKKFRYVKTRM